jgi:tetratricopeptide (TPR) repeat protein
MTDPTASPPPKLESISPAAFSTALGPDRTPRGRRSHALLLMLTLLLAAGVVFVIFILPRVVTPPAQMAVDAAPAPPAAVARPTLDSDEESAVNGANRQLSQDLLAATLEAFEAVLEQDAESWARTEVHDIRALIADGEKAYREQRHDAAKVHYEAARARIDNIAARVPERIASLIDAAQLALASGDSATADEAFGKVLALAPEHDVATAGRARARTLDQVVALVGQAEGYERMGETDKALAIYQEALAIDTLAPGAAAAVERLAQSQRTRRFRSAMSRGLAALEADDFKTARTAFEQAAALDRNNAEVGAALAHLANAETAARIAEHLGAARGAARNERWTDAVTAYDAVLATDPNLVAAQTERATAVERARLDRTLTAYLDRPERLHDDAVHAEATRFLATTRGAGPRGARIEQQMRELEQMLAQADTPLSLVLESDNATEVTLLRVGTLGRFERRAVELKPGAYVAIGRRSGYRDVRVEFSLRHGTSPEPITVVCQERIALGS